MEPGSQIGPYRVERLLGRGGMGSVYLAEHLVLRRRVALKTVAPELFGDGAVRERFLQECRMVATIDHRNVIPVFDAAEQDGLVFVAMRYVEGTDLTGLIAREGSLEPDEALAIVDQVGSALDAVHQRAIVHRDVKPANILIEGADGRVFLADFGIATQSGATGRGRDGLIAGTIDYCAPEQLEGSEVGPATDVYALGCVLFQSLTGHRPFERDTDVAVFHAQLLAPPPSLLSLKPDLPPALEDVITRVLAKAPDQRFASCRALVDAARAAIVGRPRRPTASAAPGVAPAPAPATAGLPAPPTSVLGRQDEVAELVGLLRSTDARLVTITGPPGSGKSRLALEVAAASATAFEGMFYVELALAREPRLVPTVVAEALGIEESREDALLEAFRVRFAAGTTLILLDNFDQVLEAAPLISRMLAATRGLKVLATSQAALELRGEHEFVLSPLALPEEHAGSPGSVGVAPAVELFVERARATRPDFELTEENAATVAQICRRLDGLPLAIELAASLVKLLSPEAILRRLDTRFELLTGGARDVPERHRTLRSAIDWSYEQLEQDEQRLFVRLGVFVGGSTFESIAAVCDDPEEVRPGELFELLGALVDKSLVLQRPGPDGEPRFATLESVRLYALERVAEAQQDELRERHARHFLGLVEAAEPELTRAGQSVWREQLIDQAGNVRAALGWLLQSHQADAAARMATALTRFWSVRGLTSEGRGWVRSVLELDTLTPELRAKSLFAAGYLTLDDDLDDARALFGESLALARSIPDVRLEAAVLAQIAWILSAAAAPGGSGDDGAEAAERSLALARETDDAVTASAALNVLGQAASRAGDQTRARALYEESLALRQALGDTRLCANSLFHLGELALRSGDRDVAIERYEEGLALARTIGDTWGTSLALAELAGLHLLAGAYARAESLGTEALALARARGGRRVLLSCLQQAGALLLARGNAAEAVRLWGAAEAQLREIGSSPSRLEELIAAQFGPAALTALGPKALEAERAAGTAMGLDEAVALAAGNDA